MCLTVSAGAAGAGTLSDYRLLFLGGGPVKWGTPKQGAGSVVTYALADGARTVKGARNCGAIIPIDTLLAQNGISRARFDAELSSAFQAWSAAANIRFAPAPAEEANIIVGAQANPAGRAFTNVDSKPAGPSTIGTIVSSTICLNPEQRWKIGFDRNLDVYDLRYTLMHEIGHAIGLDHPGTPEALMDFRYLEAFSSLQAGDREGAIALYGPAKALFATQTQAAPKKNGPPAEAASGRERAIGSAENAE